MKTSKRILGVALALIMIFNVFAIGTFAASDAAIKLIVATADGKTVYAPGDEITFAVSFQSNEEVGKLNAYGQHQFAYNSSVLKVYDTTIDPTTETVKLSKQGLVMDASQTTFVDNNSAVALHGIGTSGEIYDNAYGWDETVQHNVYVDACYVDTISAPYQFYTFKMKIAEDAAYGEYVFGFNAAGYDEYDAYASSEKVAEIYAPDENFSTDTFDYGTCTFTVGEAAPAVVVAHEGTQSKWAKGNPVIADYLFGFVGSFTGLEVETESVNGRNEVTNIESIVAAATVNGGEVRYSTVNTIWKSGDKYMFRAAFAGFDPTGDDVVSVEFTVTMKDGKTFTTEAASVKAVADIYAASVAANPGLKPLA